MTLALASVVDGAFRGRRTSSWQTGLKGRQRVSRAGPTRFPVPRPRPHTSPTSDPPAPRSLPDPEVVLPGHGARVLRPRIEHPLNPPRDFRVNVVRETPSYLCLKTFYDLCPSPLLQLFPTWTPLAPDGLTGHPHLWSSSPGLVYDSRVVCRRHPVGRYGPSKGPKAPQFRDERPAVLLAAIVCWVDRVSTGGSRRFSPGGRGRRPSPFTSVLQERTPAVQERVLGDDWSGRCTARRG